MAGNTRIDGAQPVRAQDAVAAPAGEVEADDIAGLQCEAGLRRHVGAVDAEPSGRTGLPPKMPSGGLASRLVTALSCHGRVVSTVNSIV